MADLHVIIMHHIIKKPTLVNEFEHLQACRELAHRLDFG